MGLFGRAKQKDQTIEQLKFLLEKFEFTDLEKLCNDVLGRVPKSTDERPEKIQLLEFIWEHYRKRTLDFQQVKDFAIKQGIVPSNSFD